MLKKFGGDVSSANYDIIVIIAKDGWSGAIPSPDSESMVYKSYVFINRNLLSYKNWKQN